MQDQLEKLSQDVKSMKDLLRPTFHVFPAQPDGSVPEATTAATKKEDKVACACDLLISQLTTHALHSQKKS